MPITVFYTPLFTKSVPVMYILGLGTQNRYQIDQKTYCFQLTLLKKNWMSQKKLKNGQKARFWEILPIFKVFRLFWPILTTLTNDSLGSGKPIWSLEQFSPTNWKSVENFVMNVILNRRYWFPEKYAKLYILLESVY